MKKFLITPFILTIFLIACSKQIEPPKYDPGSLTDFNFSFQQTDLDYVKIPEGTYFLYKDSASSSIDSVIVTTSYLEYSVHPAFASSCFVCSGSTYPAYSYLSFTLQLYKNDGINQVEWFKGMATINNPKAPIILSPNTINGIQPLMLMETITSPNSMGISNSLAFDLQTRGTTIPKLNIEGIEYTNVVMFAHASSTYYWAKGVGIIKRSLTKGSTTHTWTLVKKGN